ncbi:MAG: DsbA family oxidoreductase, partial [Ottowia sp.]|nr:DsbA family oxidoreductase [Ottowia sp.]
YVGKRRLEQALAGFAHAADTEIIWHAFELDPRAPRVRTGTQRNVERLAAKYRVTPAQAQQMIDRLIETGAGAGLDLRLHDSRGGNTFDGHRLLHWALDEGGPAAQGALKERLLRAYHTEAAAIGEPEVLAALADDVGLAGAAAILATSRYADSVRADEATARDLGVTGVPFFVLAGRMAIAGAQPASLMAGSLARA